MLYVYRSLMPCIRDLLVKGTIFLSAKHARYLPMSQIVHSVRVTNVSSRNEDYETTRWHLASLILCLVTVETRCNASHLKIWSVILKIYIIRLRIMRKSRLNDTTKPVLYIYIRRINFNLRLCIAILIQLNIILWDLCSCRGLFYISSNFVRYYTCGFFLPAQRG